MELNVRGGQTNDCRCLLHCGCGLDIEPDNLFSLIQGYDSRLDTLESSSGVSLPYVDLRFAPLPGYARGPVQGSF